MNPSIFRPLELDRIRQATEHRLFRVFRARAVQRKSAPGEEPGVTGVAQRVEHAPDEGADGALVGRHGECGQHVGTQPILGVVGQGLGEPVTAAEVVEDRGV